MNRKEWARCPRRSSKWITKTRRQAIYRRDRHRCVYCKDSDPAGLTLDHIIPRSKGGSHEPKNLVTACTWCNSVRGHKSLKEFAIWLSRQLMSTLSDSPQDILRRVQNAKRRKLPQILVDSNSTPK